MHTKQTLAVCFIARNEEKMLPHALASVKDVADEVIVVDTGSSDATVEIARQSGAFVYEEKWCDDFSHSRNQAIDKAQSDWILCLDADETLRSGQAKSLRRLLKSSRDAWFVQICSPLTGSRSGQVFTHHFERLFRRLPGVYFSGRVHEQVGPALRSRAARVGTSQLVLDHTGYAIDPLQRETKLRRNLHLLMLDLADREQVGYVHFHLGETYSLLGEPNSALVYYRQALSSEDLTAQYRIATHQNLSSAAQKVGQWAYAIDHATQALALEPGAHSARLVRAAAHMKSGNLEAAIEDLDIYLRACASKKSTALSFGVQFDPLGALRIRGECYLRAGKMKQAHADARHILAQQPRWAGGYRLQGRIHMTEGDLEAAAASFDTALDIDPVSEATWIDLVRLHLSRNDRVAARAIFERASNHVRSAELYRLQAQLDLLEGRLEEALTDYQHVLELAPQDPEALRRVIGLNQTMGRTEEALVYLSRMGERA